MGLSAGINNINHGMSGMWATFRTQGYTRLFMTFPSVIHRYSS